MTLPASKSVPMPKPRGRMPERIGKYVVIREVGRGSTGVVYLSHDAYYGRDVAIKVYNMDAGGDEERARWPLTAVPTICCASMMPSRLYSSARRRCTTRTRAA